MIYSAFVTMMTQRESSIDVRKERYETPAHAPTERKPVLQTAWYISQTALVIALALAAYCAAWEYSTRSYLRGFSDAVIPASASPIDQIQAILNWMSHGPTRDQSTPGDVFPDRDPSDTLNYAALLRTCGSATNAFINLADTTGLSTRRLLLQDAHGSVAHVVAEAWVDGRWIVVDPTFRTVMKGADGHPLTREELMDSSTLANATRDLQGYSPAYNYRNTGHLHMARLPFGNFTASALTAILPGWDGSPAISLLVERSSLAAAVASIAAAAILSLVRFALLFLRRRQRISELATAPAA
jgi:transglutaminase-like putative cysteine protease